MASINLDRSVAVLCSLASKRTDEFATLATPLIDTYSEAIEVIKLSGATDIRVKTSDLSDPVIVIRKFIGHFLFMSAYDSPESSQALHALFGLKLLFSANVNDRIVISLKRLKETQ